MANLPANLTKSLESLAQFDVNAAATTPVVGGGTPPQTIFLKVEEYLQNRDGGYAVKGISVENGQEMIISLFPLRENQIRKKEISNFVNDPIDGSLSVGTAVGGVIRFDGCYQQQDGGWKSSYAALALRTQNDGAVDYPLIHKEINIRGGHKRMENGVTATFLDKRVVVGKLLKSPSKEERLIGNLLKDESRNLIPIPYLANKVDMLHENGEHLLTQEQATSLLTKIADRHFRATDPFVAREYLAENNASYSVSVLKKDQAISVSTEESLKSALLSALKCPENDPNMKGEVQGYSPKAIIRLLGRNEGQVGDKSVAIAISPNRVKDSYGFEPLSDDINTIMKTTKVQAVLDVLNEPSMDVVAEVIPLRVFRALEGLKKKMNQFTVEQIIENNFTREGEAIYAKELVALKAGKDSRTGETFLFVYSVAPKSRADLNASKVTLASLATSNLVPDNALLQINAPMQETKTSEPVPIALQNPTEQPSSIGQTEQDDFDPNFYDQGGVDEGVQLQPKNKPKM